MPRIRSIKPDFWKSEKVATRLRGEDGRQARLLFIALWNFAEDHGVVRGNAAYLRAEVFPYEEDITTADVERWLELLEAGSFIVRFTRDGSRFVWIRGFKEHQRIEKPSKPTLPFPSDAERTREGSGSTPGGLGEGSRADMEVDLGSGDGDGGGEEACAEAQLPLAAAAAVAPETVEDLQEAWNRLAPEPLPRWRETGPKRRKAAKARLRERPMAEWREIIRRIGESSFCRGGGRDGWVANPDWLLRPDTAAKVLEGNYDDRARAGASPPDRQVGRSGNEGECAVCGAHGQVWGCWGFQLCMPDLARANEAGIDSEGKASGWIFEQRREGARA